MMYNFDMIHSQRVAPHCLQINYSILYAAREGGALIDNPNKQKIECGVVVTHTHTQLSQSTPTANGLESLSSFKSSRSREANTIISNCNSRLTPPEVLRWLYKQPNTDTVQKHSDLKLFPLHVTFSMKLLFMNSVGGEGRCFDQQMLTLLLANNIQNQPTDKQRNRKQKSTDN